MPRGQEQFSAVNEVAVTLHKECLRKLEASNNCLATALLILTTTMLSIKENKTNAVFELKY